ncbi:unnamed protein product [Adineta steineri]|uniref:Uncharacterized protein n=1 Tax=Adineta steineri TaxID=433720 RepID=A0A815CK91_9BILA|nr:unnamed protein product [Adineta steineri]CAF1286277.1 unnamed protein product [Adineta steineri]CAF1309048.1 unnamed protein product [Adineta steineri]CAF3502238.1 unnamed protein product [Adineta steineri]CAF3570360.1 unnamed protein product [Adineta steineri]
MPQQTERLSFIADDCVSDIDYSEARNILDLTTIKQKQLRRQRSQSLYTQLLLKRTYTHVCQLLDSDCTVKKSLPLAIIDTNKRKLSSDDHQVPTMNKKSKTCADNDILQFLQELNAVKILPRY